MPSSDSPDVLPVKQLALGTFLPIVLHAIGSGAVVPLLVNRGVSLGASIGLAALITGAGTIGSLTGNIPATWVSMRVGDRLAMFSGSAISAISFVIAAVSHNILSFIFALIMAGAAGAVFDIARHSYLTRVTPAHQRARVMSTLGGVSRIGFLVGPLLGAGVVHLWGTSAAFWLGATTATTAAAVVLIANPRGEKLEPRPMEPMWHIWRSYRPVLLRLGTSMVLAVLARAIRGIAIPVWAEVLGLEPSQISILFAIAYTFEVALFYPVGWLMDRFGRLSTAVPSLVAVAVGLIVLPLSSSFAELTLISVVLGIANGLGSGMLSTIGSDTAPPDDRRSAYLGMWRLFADVGAGTAPLIVAAAAGLGIVSVGIWIGAGSGLLAAWTLSRWYPRFANPVTSKKTGQQDHPPSAAN